MIASRSDMFERSEIASVQVALAAERHTHAVIGQNDLCHQVLDTSNETPHRRAWRPGGTRQAWRRKPGGRTRVALVTRTKLIVS
jgi:hypothetical protein